MGYGIFEREYDCDDWKVVEFPWSSFVRSPPSSRHYGGDDDDNGAYEEHRLISMCGPASWNCNSCDDNDDQDQDQDQNIDDDNNATTSSNHVGANTGQIRTDVPTVIVTLTAIPNHGAANSSRTDDKNILDGGRCIKRWFLDRFNAVFIARTCRFAN